MIIAIKGQLDLIDHYHIGSWLCSENPSDGFSSMTKQIRIIRNTTNANKEDRIMNRTPALKSDMIVVGFMIVMLAVVLRDRVHTDKEVDRD